MVDWPILISDWCVAEDGEEGLMFMQEMIELSKQPAQATDSPPKQISFTVDGQQVNTSL